MARGVTGFDGSALRTFRGITPCPYHPHRLTASCLARLVGTSKALILSYELGRSSPGPQRLAALAKAVGVPASALQQPMQAQLSDLRVARGLTLAELADRLNLAVNTYRRIESEGVLPKRRLGVFWDLANQLDVDYSHLHDAIRLIPAVQERRERAARLLEAALTQALAPGPFQALQDTSGPARVLAEIYAATTATVSNVVTMLLADLRQLALQRAQLEARRDFASHSHPFHLYERELETLSHRIAEDSDRVPDILERYLVNPMPQPCWHNLAKLYLAGPSGVTITSLPADIGAALEKAFGYYLLEPSANGVGLSVPGVLFFLDTLPYYRIIYAPPDRAIRPNPQFYGWPSFRTAVTQPHRRHRLRVAHVLGYDPRPQWDRGSWMTIQPARTGGGTRDPWPPSAPWSDEPPF